MIRNYVKCLIMTAAVSIVAKSPEGFSLDVLCARLIDWGLASLMFYFALFDNYVNPFKDDK